MQVLVLGGALVLLLMLWVAARICRVVSPELPHIRLDAAAAWFVDDATAAGQMWIIARKPEPEDGDGYDRRYMMSPPLVPGSVLFLEVAAPSLAGHAATLTVTGRRRSGQVTLRVEAWDVAEAIAAVLLHLRHRTGLTPHVYFTWPERHPLAQVIQFLLLGTGEVILVTRQLLHEAEPDPANRPTVHVG